MYTAVNHALYLAWSVIVNHSFVGWVSEYESVWAYEQKAQNSLEQRTCSGHNTTVVLEQVFLKQDANVWNCRLYIKRVMANPAGHVVLGEEEAQRVTKGYSKMKTELQALQQRNV